MLLPDYDDAFRRYDVYSRKDYVDSIIYDVTSGIYDVASRKYDVDSRIDDVTSRI